MAVVSIRFSDEPLHGRLKESARRRGQGVSPLAERLIDEGLRMDAHPAVLFRDGPAGRRAVLVGGPEVADVIGGLIGGDVPAAQRRSRAAELLGLSEAMVDAALAYYADEPATERPAANLSLEAMLPVINAEQPLFYHADDELDYQRALNIQDEFDLDIVLVGNGYEYRMRELLAASEVGIVIPLDFPDAPRVDTPDRALGVSLEQLVRLLGGGIFVD